jgi:hydrogenase nickel incorporation protein HypA/HybF
MHELAIAESLVEHVEQVAEGRCVRKVTVEIGVHSCVSADALRFSFGLLVEGTVATDSELEVIPVAGDALKLKSMAIEEYA